MFNKLNFLYLAVFLFTSGSTLGSNKILQELERRDFNLKSYGSWSLQIKAIPNSVNVEVSLNQNGKAAVKYNNNDAILISAAAFEIKDRKGPVFVTVWETAPHFRTLRVLDPSRESSKPAFEVISLYDIEYELKEPEQTLKITVYRKEDEKILSSDVQWSFITDSINTTQNASSKRSVAGQKKLLKQKK